jgi:hypothetical protein
MVGWFSMEEFMVRRNWEPSDFQTLDTVATQAFQAIMFFFRLSCTPFILPSTSPNSPWVIPPQKDLAKIL